MQHNNLIVGLLLLAALQCPMREKQVPRKRMTYPSKVFPIVELTTDCSGCTAFVVKPGVFVTAAHCLGVPTKHIWARFVDGKKVPLKLVKKGDDDLHPEMDVAVLTGDTRGAPPAHLLPLPSKDIFECISVGYGLDRKQKMVPCAGAMLEVPFAGLYKFGGVVEHGDSGGPVVDLDGNVRAMQVSIYGPDVPMFDAVGAENILKMIKEAGL